jgi:nucleotide-binding universal stress UspA family protein
MSTVEPPVTVGVDGSEASLAAADWAAREALLRDRPLRVLHALPPVPRRTDAGPDREGPLHEAGHMLAVRYPQVRIHLEEARDAATAALLAASEDADLLVLGARGDGGFPGLRVGSTALLLAARSGCPTVVLPADPPGPALHEQVVVGVDARRPAEAALEFAFAAAQRYGLPLHAVHASAAGARDGEDEVLARALKSWQASYPEVEVVPDTDCTGAGLALVEASAKARLLVVGRRRTVWVGLLGPVAHAVLHHAACPVAVVPET